MNTKNNTNTINYALPMKWASFVLDGRLLPTDQAETDCMRFLSSQGILCHQIVSISKRYNGISHHNLQPNEVCVYTFSIEEDSVG